jgi:hypothetical protein
LVFNVIGLSGRLAVKSCTVILNGLAQKLSTECLKTLYKISRKISSLQTRTRYGFETDTSDFRCQSTLVKASDFNRLEGHPWSGGLHTLGVMRTCLYILAIMLPLTLWAQTDPEVVGYHPGYVMDVEYEQTSRTEEFNILQLPLVKRSETSRGSFLIEN